MATIKKVSNGEYYVFKRYGKNNMFLPKYANGGMYIDIKRIYVPREFSGKKLMLKVEEIQE